MSGVAVRPVRPEDHPAISTLLNAAFGGAEESVLVENLRGAGDVVLELVAVADDAIVGQILFSRLTVGDDFDAVALAPLAVLPANQRHGVGTALVKAAHDQLQASGESLSIVLGDTAYYGRFGYTHARAAGYDSTYQGEHLQALAFREAPIAGALTYAPAFGAL